MKQATSLEEIYAPIEKKLARIPEAIFDILSTPNNLAREVICYFFSKQGKYLRPALTLFGAAIDKDEFDSDPEKLVRLAAAFEVFHSATLIHDDIIDSSYIRRNIPTVNAKWNSQVAVLVGDYLHDKAISAVFSVGNQQVVSVFLQMAGIVCDGEIQELHEKNNFNLKAEQYFEIIGKKTASLIACSIECGGILAGLPPEKVAALKRFGWFFGMAFQVVDDCLDFTGVEHEFGKTLGADCEAGVLTLPLIRLIELVDESIKDEIFTLFSTANLRGSATPYGGKFGSEEFGRLKDLLVEYGALDYAMSEARNFVEKARLELSIFPDTSIRRSLSRFLDYVLERNR